MNLELELLQLFRCRSLGALLSRTATILSHNGFPQLLLKWTPAPGAASTMVSNSSLVWHNLDLKFGPAGEDVSQALCASISVGLDENRVETIERQSWKTAQTESFQAVADAPRTFFITQYQQNLSCDFGRRRWLEFVVVPVSRERDRVLMLEALTQESLGDQAFEIAHKIVSTFSSAYLGLQQRSLHTVDTGSEDCVAQCLSQREIECLQWLASGKTLTEAATILGITERTLRFHVNNARERLGVSTTMQAVVAAAFAYGFDPNDTRRSVYAASRGALQTLKLKTG